MATEEQYKECWKCKKLNIVSVDEECRFCGVDLYKQKDNNFQKETKRFTKYCDRCSRSLEKDIKFCDRCGIKLEFNPQ